VTRIREGKGSGERGIGNRESGTGGGLQETKLENSSETDLSVSYSPTLLPSWSERHLPGQTASYPHPNEKTTHTPSSTLTRLELRRYSRQLLLPGFTLEHQIKLKSARVLVVGAGGLGSAVLPYLVGAGVGHLRIAEDDSLELHNLQRQTLYRTPQVNRPKLELALSALQQLNPLVRLEGVGRFTESNAAQLARGMDLVLDCTDNPGTRYQVNDVCVSLEQSWVWGAAQSWEGMCSRFDAQLSLRHLFPDEGVFTDDCDTVGVIGPLLGVVASQMALEALRFLTHLGESLYGRLWTFDALEGRSREIKLR